MTINLYYIIIVTLVVLSAFKSVNCVKNQAEQFTQDNVKIKLLINNNTNIVDDDDKLQKNCSPHSMDEFPNGLFNDDELKNPFVLLFHGFIGLYCFLLTAYVCNDYLLPALDVICSELQISADVAGATFLATASCFPELFVNVVGTFVTKSDLGVGTVVGGAVFNTFATPAFGALSASQAIQLDSWILSRDCIIYIVSVTALVIVMWDERISWIGSVLLMTLFAGYFTLLFLNNSVVKASGKIHGFFKKTTKAVVTEADEETPLIFRQPGAQSEPESIPSGVYRPFVHGELSIEYRKSLQLSKKIDSSILSQNGNNNSEKIDDFIEPETPFNLPPNDLLKILKFILTWPIRFVLFITIPDTRYKRLRFWYPITFIMCITWIALSSYLASWMTTIVGDTLGISDSIMGITFLAAGGNMPELVSIVILSRQGNGNMAMSNTLGANTLDILMCLGLPWGVKAIMTGQDVIIESGAIVYSVLSIILCVIGFFCITAYYKFQLNKKVGFACLIMYSIFLVFSILLESNVFFPVNLPICDK
ncbi:sodium/potassium/calcium exchanger 3-like isoform X2 [Aphidius gifuensis]|uniref:sodium/potassium/calcium exchanger 3-like isoform X2 n=1 Tax=Aphidius gifuensis TaxID=684658 RepID=UPI001CDB5EAE|nr:sodium/potassium/calcium exchanger 3-like isoform X2 [Aphidius gifuensis]